MSLLTKSRYIQGLQCPKLLWLSLQKHPALKPDGLKQFIFDQGDLIGKTAQQIFRDGVEILQSFPFMEKINQTKQLLHKKKTIFEATFLWNKCYCQVDVLNFSDSGWDIIEVKSSTSVKQVHLFDVAFQYYVLSQSGIQLNNVYLYHVNTDYVRESLFNPSSFFCAVNVTDQVKELLIETEKNISNLLSILSMDQSQLPIGPHCFSPYECSAMSHCWSSVPEDSIFDLIDMPMQDKFTHYFNNSFLLNQLSPDMVHQNKQKRQIACYLEEQDYIDEKKIQAFLSGIVYPISFLDFECVQFAIPPYDKMSPYDQLPFQFSLHVDDQSLLIHDLFIAPFGEDPRLLFLKKLYELLPNHGSIVVYNASYESLILTNLKQLYPDYAVFIDNVIRRFVDLQIPFKHQYIYLRAMKGKSSIKSVLPALCPEYSYDNLPISSGRMINQMYQQLSDESRQSDILSYLHDYGAMDTYAMHLILEQLKQY